MIVYKYVLHKPDAHKTYNIKDATSWNRIIHAEEQRGELCIWVLLDDEQPIVMNHEVYILGTGFESATLEERDYRCTAVMSSGLVWHIFAGN